MKAAMTAFGGYVPDKVIGNSEVAEWISETPEWIIERTGILERRYADAKVPTSELAYLAVLDMAKQFPGCIEGVSTIILATSTPDQPQPPTADRLQHLLGLSGIPTVDINRVCTGFLFALHYADLWAERLAEKVLVVAADKYSAIMNRSDRKTVSLFGDGAGAVIVEPGSDPDAGLRSLCLATHGELADLVKVPAGGTVLPRSAAEEDHLFQMDGRAVKEYVLRTLPPLLDEACEKAGVKLGEIGAFVCHQANVRLLEILADALGLSDALIPMTAPQYGNTGAASLPITLAAAHREGCLKPGVPVALLAVGGGMSAGAAIYVP